MNSLKVDTVILERLQENAEGLEKLYVSLNSEWALEDIVYRFYHESFKVYYAVNHIQAFWRFVTRIAGDDLKINTSLSEIVEPILDKKFNAETSRNWDHETRPIIEALFHVKYFVDMMYKYSKDLGTNAPQCMPSGWAAVLYLFRSR